MEIRTADSIVTRWQKDLDGSVIGSWCGCIFACSIRFACSFQALIGFCSNDAFLADQCRWVLEKKALYLIDIFCKWLIVVKNKVSCAGTGEVGFILDAMDLYVVS